MRLLGPDAGRPQPPPVGQIIEQWDRYALISPEQPCLLQPKFDFGCISLVLEHHCQCKDSALVLA